MPKTNHRCELKATQGLTVGGQKFKAGEIIGLIELPDSYTEKSLGNDLRTGQIAMVPVAPAEEKK